MQMRWQYIVLTLFLLYLIFHLFKSRIRNITNLLPKHPTRTFYKRSLAQIEQIVVHHTAGPDTQTPYEVAKYHIGSNHVCDEGCPGILYHYYITRSGRIYQVNELETITWHIAGQNTRSVGVVFAGNYDNYPATSQQLKALKTVINTVERKVDRSLNMTNHQAECGGCTDCPGDYLLEQITY